jgi:hypothetical protein
MCMVLLYIMFWRRRRRRIDLIHDFLHLALF